MQVWRRWQVGGMRRKPATCHLQPATCHLPPATCHLQPATSDHKEKTMTDELMNKAKDQMNVLERVVAGVPGYKGYKEKELRSGTDKTLRTVLTRQIEDQKSAADCTTGRIDQRRPARLDGRHGALRNQDADLGGQHPHGQLRLCAALRRRSCPRKRNWTRSRVESRGRHVVTDPRQGRRSIAGPPFLGSIRIVRTDQNFCGNRFRGRNRESEPRSAKLARPAPLITRGWQSATSVPRPCHLCYEGSWLARMARPGHG